MTGRKIAAVVLVTLVVVVAGTAATRLLEGTGSSGSQAGAKEPMPGVADPVTTSLTPPSLTPENIARLGRVGISPNEGPTVSTESDPDPGRLPTARQVGMLASLPADWTTAFLVATDALEALGTPQPSRSAALQPRVSNELYVNWQRALSGTRTPGTFALTRLSLGSAGVGKNGELPVTGAGWYTAGAQRTRFVVTGTLQKMRTGWIVTDANFVGLGAGR